MAIVLQSHYLALLLQPVFWLFLLLTFLRIVIPLNKKISPQTIKRTFSDKLPVLKVFFANLALGLIAFSVLMSPLLIFDARHGWRNVSAIHTFFTQRQTTVSIRPWTAIPEIPMHFENTFSRLLSGFNKEVASLYVIIIASTLFLFFVKKVKKFNEVKVAAMFLVTVWLVVAYVGFGLYKQEIYDHYFGFIFPALFILVAGLFSIVSSFRGGRVLAVLLFIPLAALNLNSHPLRYPPNNQLERTEAVAEYIKRDSNNEAFNFAVIAERNYEGAYEYFLEGDGNFKRINPQQAKETITKQLYVACELPIEKCQPVGHPKAEIAGFGPSKIDKRENVMGVEVFRLVSVKIEK